MPELKVTISHLDRDAYLYIRQSTPRQVLENTESTQRQYALGDRAVAQAGPGSRSMLSTAISVNLDLKLPGGMDSNNWSIT